MNGKITFALLVSTLFVAVSGYGQEPQKMTEGMYKGWYGSGADTTSVWHPERIFVVWPGMDLEFRLPWEQERSGVANLFFRDKKSGEVLLLDSVKVSRFYQSTMWANQDVAHIKDARYANRFEQGNYDAILLYNNGKYITYNNLSLSEGMNAVVDMAQEPVAGADEDSREWLRLRKFTDIVGERTLIKNYAAAAQNKVLGYLFFPEGEAANFSMNLKILDKNDPTEWKGVKMGAPSYDGYFEIDLEDDDKDSVLEIWSPGFVTRGIRLKPNTGLFFVMEMEPILEEVNVAPKGTRKVEVYEREFSPDTKYLWHPERFHIIWPGMRVDFEFPEEKELSGVANLLIRDRRSGEIGLLDDIREDEDGNTGRYYTRFEAGNYDAILLYNSGKYIVYENIALEQGVRMTVDMTEQPVRPADADSRQWVELRKFNDIIGTRKIRSWYRVDNIDVKVSGYIFDPKTGLACSGIEVKHPTESDRRTFSSSDGYFEYNPVESGTGSTLEIRQAGYEDMKIEIGPDAGYFIAMEYTPYEIPKMIE